VRGGSWGQKSEAPILDGDGGCVMKYRIEKIRHYSEKRAVSKDWAGRAERRLKISNLGGRSRAGRRQSTDVEVHKSAENLQQLLKMLGS